MRLARVAPSLCCVAHIMPSVSKPAVTPPSMTMQPAKIMTLFAAIKISEIARKPTSAHSLALAITPFLSAKQPIGYCHTKVPIPNSVNSHALSWLLKAKSAWYSYSTKESDDVANFAYSSFPRRLESRQAPCQQISIYN